MINTVWFQERASGRERKIVDALVKDGEANNNYCVKGVSAVVLGTVIFLEGSFPFGTEF